MSALESGIIRSPQEMSDWQVLQTLDALRNGAQDDRVAFNKGLSFPGERIDVKRVLPETPLTSEGSWLRDEVSVLKRKKDASDGTPWYFLSGTGFFVAEQTSKLLTSLRSHVHEQGSFAQLRDRELEKVGKDIKAFEQEFLMQLPVLPILHASKEVNGEERMICQNYGDQVWEEVITRQERAGSVYETLFEGDPDRGVPSIEKYLLTAPEGSLAVMTSPPGWSGFTYADGSEIVYPECQTYVWQVQADRSIRGFSLRSELDLDQNEVLLERLGKKMEKPEFEQTVEERIVGVVKHPVFF